MTEKSPVGRRFLLGLMCFRVTDAIENSSSSLPAVDSSNNGGVLKVINGAWGIGYAETSETLTSTIQVTHSFSEWSSTMSISSVPFQPTHPWVKCYSNISFSSGSYGSYTCSSYGQKTPGNNLLIVGAYCRSGQDTSWTYQTWYLNLDSTGTTLKWVTAGSKTADNHGGSGSYVWQFNLSVTGYFE